MEVAEARAAAARAAARGVAATEAGRVVREVRAVRAVAWAVPMAAPVAEEAAAVVVACTMAHLAEISDLEVVSRETGAAAAVVCVEVAVVRAVVAVDDLARNRFEEKRREDSADNEKEKLMDKSAEKGEKGRTSRARRRR